MRRTASWSSMRARAEVAASSPRCPSTVASNSGSSRPRPTCASRRGDRFRGHDCHLSNARRDRGAHDFYCRRWHAQLSLDRIGRSGTRRLLDARRRRRHRSTTAARAGSSRGVSPARRPAAHRRGGVTGSGRGFGRARRSAARSGQHPVASAACSSTSTASSCKDEYRPLVEAHARYLQQNRNARMTLQGHTDERGSREYNIALGQKRADSVKRMMTLLGAPEPDRDGELRQGEAAEPGSRRRRLGGEPPRRHRLRERLINRVLAWRDAVPRTAGAQRLGGVRRRGGSFREVIASYLPCRSRALPGGAGRARGALRRRGGATADRSDEPADHARCSVRSRIVLC